MGEERGNKKLVDGIFLMQSSSLHGEIKDPAPPHNTVSLSFFFC